MIDGGTSSAVRRTGAYAGCIWLALAALLAIGAYFGLAIAGPSGIPSVLLLLALAAVASVLAAGLMTGVGGRPLATVSLVVGAVGFAAALFEMIASRDPVSVEPFGYGWFAVAIVLSSAFALAGAGEHPGRRARRTFVAMIVVLLALLGAEVVFVFLVVTGSIR